MNSPLLTNCPDCGKRLSHYGNHSQDGPVFIRSHCDDCGVIGPVVSAPRMPPGTADTVGLPSGFLDPENDEYGELVA